MRPRVFNLEQVGRAGAVLLVAAAVVASAVTIHLGNRRRPSAVPVHAVNPVGAGLERCRGLGTAAADDAQCQAIWTDLRRRFFAPSARTERAP